MELVCPAGNLPSLKAAVDNGANAVYIGFRDATNARHFAGLNFDAAGAEEGVGYAHARGVKVFVAINTYPHAAGWHEWQRAVDRAAELRADALILADVGVMDYAAARWPDLPLHLSVQASATSHEAIAFYHRSFGIRRAVLPRVLSATQIERLAQRTPVALEVFGFGGLCVMAEGRCHLSSYVTGKSPNTFGVCSPASAVRWEETPEGLETRLNGVLIDRYASGEQAGYPTLCKGRFKVGEQTYYAIEEPTSLNVVPLLPRLRKIGVAAIKLEGRQRSPAYVAAATRVMRAAIDACERGPEAHRQRTGEWLSELDRISEGVRSTLGAYHRPWQ